MTGAQLDLPLSAGEGIVRDGNGCCCRYGGLPDVNGYRFISPCCSIHWSPLRIPVPFQKPEEEIDWKAPVKKSRQNPKMFVAGKRKAA